MNPVVHGIYMFQLQGILSSPVLVIEKNEMKN